MPATPRFFYFDLGNVLLKFDHELACRQIATLAGITTAAARTAIFDSQLQWQYERGEVDSRQFYEQFCERTGTCADFSGLLNAASEIFQLNMPVVPIVAHLRTAGHRLGILSNTCDAHWQYISSGRYWLVPGAFHVIALSYELRSMKPAPQIYSRAAELADCDPEEIFFVDDREDNVAGALEAGFDAVLFTSARQLARDLHNRKVRFNF